MPTAPSRAAPSGPDEPVALADLFRPRADLPPLADLDALPALPEGVRDLVLDRLDAAWREGVLKVSAETFEAIQLALLPDDATPRPAPPCPAAVGTPGRIAAYAERAARRLPVCSAADADPAADDRLPGVRVRPRKNGAGRKAPAGAPEAEVKALGFAAPAPARPPAGMYRAADGTWFEVAS